MTGARERRSATSSGPDPRIAAEDNDKYLVLPEDTSEVPTLMALIEADEVEHGVYPDGRRWIKVPSE